jgi:hypothetical protein
MVVLDLKSKLDTNALAQGKGVSCPTLGDNQYIEKLYLHWTVENPGWRLPGYYNYIIDTMSGIYITYPSTSPTYNAGDYPLPVDANGNNIYAAHTWQRNDHAVGIGLNCLSTSAAHPDTGAYDFGDHPVTLSGIEAMCATAGKLCLIYTIDPLGVIGGDRPRAGESTIMTHSGAAINDGYFWTDNPADGQTRGDLFALNPLPPGIPVTKEMALGTQELLRQRIAQYYQAYATMAGTIH